MLNKGASVESKDKWGRTALHRGAVTGHEECVEALLQHSANFLVRDCKGRTPMHLAAACGHMGVLGGLLHAAQAVETLPVLTDNKGYTPLHWACYNGHDTCVELLLEQEVFHKTEGNLFSPLHCAVIHDNEGAAEMLIDTIGPKIVNTTDTKNRTPLHAAAFTDHVECLQLLLSHNAQVNSVDATGRTSLMMAAENGQTNAVGYTPALACAPNKDVADCLALILATMMPVFPCTQAPSLPFSAINHHTTNSPSKSITFDSMPALHDEHTSYCSFNNISHHHDDSYKDEELNDSDSETY
ncbi:hypothetical protein CRUP_018052 [Coryphaenoides rupestris]|nr:hypothetical protein CRUP_018052 [Coryphaenoides rupestris]